MMKPTKFNSGASAGITIRYLKDGMDRDGGRIVEDYYAHDGGAASKFLGSAMKRFGLESSEFDTKT